MIGNIPENVELFAEEIPLDELTLTEDDKIINVFHFSKDLARTHGVPFRFVVKRNEPFKETRARLQERLEIPEKEFSKYRFALVQSSTYKQPTYLEDDDLLYEHKFLPDDALGLDHPDRSGRAGRFGNNVVQDKGIRIRN